MNGEQSVTLKEDVRKEERVQRFNVSVLTFFHPRAN
jgi:hypothetical protein